MRSKKTKSEKEKREPTVQEEGLREGTCAGGPPVFSTAPGTRIGRTVAVMSGKGGVGKSAFTMLMAAALKRRGFEVGVLDADITGPSIPKGLGVKGPLVVGPAGAFPAVSPGDIKVMSMNLILTSEEEAVIWRGPLISSAVRQFYEECNWGELDYLLIDLPPGTADVPLTIMQSINLDGIILVTSPQELAGVIVGKAVNMAAKLAAPIVGLVENMSYVRCDSCGQRLEPFGPSHGEEAARRMGTVLLGRLPVDSRISEFADSGEIELYESEEVEEVIDRAVSRLGSQAGAKSEAQTAFGAQPPYSKVAVVMAGKDVSPHFGRAEEFMVVEISDGEIKSRELLKAPEHECGALPALLAEKGVECLIAGGIGGGAIEHLMKAGIEVYSGAQGSAEDALGRLLSGTLASGGAVCEGGMGTCGHESSGGTGCGH